MCVCVCVCRKGRERLGSVRGGSSYPLLIHHCLPASLSSSSSFSSSSSLVAPLLCRVHARCADYDFSHDVSRQHPSPPTPSLPPSIPPHSTTATTATAAPPLSHTHTLAPEEAVPELREERAGGSGGRGWRRCSWMLREESFFFFCPSRFGCVMHGERDKSHSQAPEPAADWNTHLSGTVR